MRVLLVDDEKEFASTLTERLNLRGIEAHCAFDAREALALADEYTFDVALLDVKMPGVSGLSLATRLEDKHPGMKFIFLTGHTSEHDLTEGLKRGTFYLLKPVNIDVLMDKLREAVSGGKDDEQ